MEKIKVLFPRVEAGFGHIITMDAVAKLFEEKYGDKVEVINLNFYKETDSKRLKQYEKLLILTVKNFNSNPFFGFFISFLCEIAGTRLASWVALKAILPGSYKASIKQIKKYSPDVVFSTHWATNYYAMHMKNRPLTILYCPDAVMNKMFLYPSDLCLVSMKNGYDKAIKKKCYNEDNLKLVPFLIREQVYEIKNDKYFYREELNLPKDKFTILIAEGGYGRGKMKKLVKLLIKENIPITVIAICGKNKKLCSFFKSLIPAEQVTFIPFAFSKDILYYIKASDLFCGKSGNMIAEPTFFCVPSIITSYTTLVEKHIGEFYLNIVGSAMKEFNIKKVVALIKSFIDNPELLIPYQEAAIKYHYNYGAEETVEIIWKKLTQKFPQLKDQKGDDLQ